MGSLARRASLRAFEFAVASLAAGALSFSAQASQTITTLRSVQVIRHGEAQEIRFAFTPVAPVMHLSAHGDELWIDLDRARIAIPPRPLYGEESPPIGALRAVDADGRSRIVVEVKGKADYAIGRINDVIIFTIAPAGAEVDVSAPVLAHRYDKPQRVTTEADSHLPIRPRRRPMAEPPVAIPNQGSIALNNRAPDETTHGERVDLSSPAGGAAPFVVIDPGHGGFDPGTRSDSGLLEKDLALQIALQVRRALIDSGYRAEMTRSTDDFVTLHDRTQIANRAGADLFLSIHLNWSPNPETSGIEVYYLNNTTDRATVRLASMENGGASDYGAPEGSNLNYILADLRQNYKANESALLARMIDAQAVADLRAGLGVDVSPLGAKMGPFYVLVGAHMPAVLVECGFLSNRGEARRLKTAAYQEVLADGIAEAVVHYLRTEPAAGNL
jgi:N-acetylmuramoyl-L-alanine amidase